MARIMFMVIIVVLHCLFAAPPVSASREKRTKQVAVQKPIITAMDIESNISNRFSQTLVKSKMKNPSKVAQETTFVIEIPDRAYISSFKMEIGGIYYTAYLQEKKVPNKTYEKAVASGKSAALVAISDRNSKKFTVSVNVEPEVEATFYLTYEELLERKFGYYEQIINIRPKQILKSINVLVAINELRPLTFVNIPSIRSGNEVKMKAYGDSDPKAIINRPESNKAVVKFSPNTRKQKQIVRCLRTDTKEGMSAQFVVQYDVERDQQGGEVLVKDGYFVHFFEPSDLEPLHKYIVLVLDVVTKEAKRKVREIAISILEELKPTDFFSVIEFSNVVRIWNLTLRGWDDAWDGRPQSPYAVNTNNIDNVKFVIGKKYFETRSDIFAALRYGLLVCQQPTVRPGTQPIIVLLSDGMASYGRQDPDSIISGISELNTMNVPIISISFDNAADRNFLKKLSLRNNGFTRHLHEESFQVDKFFEEISYGLLQNVKFSYAPDVTSLTQTEFPTYFRDAEFVVAGKIPDGEFKSESLVTGTGPSGLISLRPVVHKTVGQVERLWAYMTVKKYLDELKMAGDDIKEIKKKTSDLALKFSFMTPVTSLVVMKPIASSVVATEATDSSEMQYATNEDGCYGMNGRKVYIIAENAKRLERSEVRFKVDNVTVDLADSEPLTVFGKAGDAFAMWTLESAGINKCALKADNGYYAARCNDCGEDEHFSNSLFVYSPNSKPANTQFEMEKQGEYFSFKSDNGTYIGTCQLCFTDINSINKPSYAFVRDYHLTYWGLWKVEEV